MVKYSVVALCETSHAAANSMVFNAKMFNVRVWLAQPARSLHRYLLMVISYVDVCSSSTTATAFLHISRCKCEEYDFVSLRAVIMLATAAQHLCIPRA